MYGSPPKYGGHLKSCYVNFKGIPPDVFLPIFNLMGQVNVSQKWNMHVITFLEDGVAPVIRLVTWVALAAWAALVIRLAA